MIKLHLEKQLLEKSARDGKRITIDQAAKQSGVSRITLLRLKSDPYRSTSTEVIHKLCVYFNCNLSDLLELEHPVQT